MNLFDTNPKGADFSRDGKHRYRLWRIWDEDLSKAMCVGLNPSNANADKDDPTIGILSRTLKKLGYGGFYMVNCYSYISSQPKGIKINPSAEKWNDDMITVTASKCDTVIFAWGTCPLLKETGRAKEMINMFPRAMCFKHNSDGTPLHPMSIMWQGIKQPTLRPFIERTDEVHEFFRSHN